MFKFGLTRLFEAMLVLWIVVTVAFCMLQLAPGGPFDQEKALPVDVEAQLQAFYGLDLPLQAQYFRYVKNLLKGDLGPSFKYPTRTVNEIISETLPVSLELGTYAILLAVVLGIGSGLIAAGNPNSLWDWGAMGISMGGICLPSFVIGPLLVLLFSIGLGWFQSSGWYEPRDRVLPTITLGVFYAAYIARLTRGSMIEVMKQDYIRTAYAKGLSRWAVVWKHGLKNGLSPVVSYLGPTLAGLMSGSFVIETVFHIPGLGRFFVMAAFNRDYTLVLGTILCYATFIVIFNLLFDMILVGLNPKLRSGLLNTGSV